MNRLLFAEHACFASGIGLREGNHCQDAPEGFWSPTDTLYGRPPPELGSAAGLGGTVDERLSRLRK